MNMVDRGRPVHRGQQLLGDARSGTIGRNQTTQLLLPRPGRHAGVQGRPQRPVGARPARARSASCASTRTASASTRTRSPTATTRRSGGCADAAAPTSRTDDATRRPGVWEVTVEARRTSDAANAPFTLTASILGRDGLAEPGHDRVGARSACRSPARYTLTNLFGAFTGRAVGTTLGSARLGTPTIANLAQQQYPISVTAGSTSLRATIGSPSDPAADLDLFVFNCTTGTCVLAGQSRGRRLARSR